jgi:putative transposase
LCERFGVSRPTGYKWLARHRAGGALGLEDQSRAPHQTDADIETLLVAARHE